MEFVPLLQGLLDDPTPTYGRLMEDYSAVRRASLPTIGWSLFPYYRDSCDLDRSKDRLGTVPLQALCRMGP